MKKDAPETVPMSQVDTPRAWRRRYSLERRPITGPDFAP
jgi:hypothetical protein